MKKTSLLFILAALFSLGACHHYVRADVHTTAVEIDVHHHHHHHH